MKTLNTDPTQVYDDCVQDFNVYYNQMRRDILTCVFFIHFVSYTEKASDEPLKSHVTKPNTDGISNEAEMLQSKYIEVYRVKPIFKTIENAIRKVTCGN